MTESSRIVTKLSAEAWRLRGVAAGNCPMRRILNNARKNSKPKNRISNTDSGLNDENAFAKANLRVWSAHRRDFLSDAEKSTSKKPRDSDAR
ncbi:hypothetical protein EVA_12366 [gut metagenome]|uniref:Uncharacterized protein n=1 Tax=gut metagenome TaxID=749906 RepID=J9FYA8_9ZZZZ